MKCPRCQTDDVFLSESGNQQVFAIFTVSARCHRCCHLFQVPRWKHVPKRPKPGTSGRPIQESQRRAA